MPTISVRISQEEKRQLLKFGPLSRSVREALRLYLDTKKTDEVISRLAEMQKRNPVKATTLEEVRMIREDRTR